MVSKQKEGELKFKVKTDLAIFEALQENGKLSEKKIARKTKIPATTVHYALSRLKKRSFFDIVAVPQLKRFENEIPMAVLGFNDVAPIRLEEVREEYSNKDTTLMFLHGTKEVLMFLVDSDRDRLTKTLFEIMERLDSKPSTHIIAPKVARCDVRLAKKVLEGVYGGMLVGRRKEYYTKREFID